MAQRFYPLGDEEVRERGWKWLDEDEVVVEGGDGDGVHICEESGRKFRFIGPELKFYKRYGLPLPVTAPAVRIENMWKKMGERRLLSRECADCGCEIQTTFPDDFQGRVLCEKCYLKVAW